MLSDTLRTFKSPSEFAFLFALFAGAVYAIQARGSRWWGLAVEALGSETAVSFCCIYVLPIGYFVIAACAFQALDGLASPACRARYKRQLSTVPSALDYRRAWRLALFNLTVVTAPLALAATALVRPGPEMPGAWVILYDLAISTIVEEVIFFAVHAAMHRSQLLYSRIHKVHHSYSAPFAVAAVYAHPVEHAAANILPIFAGPALAGAHPVSAGLWLAFALSTTLVEHSGWRLPLLPSPDWHDFHHQAQHGNFGVMGWMDGLLGSSRPFIATQQRERREAALAGAAVSGPPEGT